MQQKQAVLAFVVKMKKTPVPKEVADAFKTAVTKATLGKELADAYKYCQTMFNKTPLGKYTPTRDPAAVKKMAGELASGVTFSGSLGQLALMHECVPANIDHGRIYAYLSEISYLCDMQTHLHGIQINVDTWLVDAAKDLQRLTGDAEVAAACYLAWKVKDKVDMTMELQEYYSDIAFHAKKGGVGAVSMGKTLEHIFDEESKRRIIGMSSFRLCLLLSDMLEKMERERECTRT